MRIEGKKGTAYMAFHESQLQAIHHQEGPMMVLARTGIRQNHRHYPPGEISGGAVRCGAGQYPGDYIYKSRCAEMRQRFEKLTEGRRLPVSFGTFHAVFFAILKRAYRYDASNIAQDEQRTRIIRELVDKLQMDVEDEARNLHPRSFRDQPGKRRDDEPGLLLFQELLGRTVQKLYQGYEKAMVDKGLLDFDDMLVLCYELFTQRKRTSWRRGRISTSTS